MPQREREMVTVHVSDNIHTPRTSESQIAKLVYFGQNESELV